MSEVIYKKGLGKKIMIRLHFNWNHRTGWNLVEWRGMDQNLERDEIDGWFVSIN